MECAYCGCSATTRDHVPPRAFFPKPRSPDLITVPCCRSCNSTQGQNDEYIQTVIMLRDDVSKDERGGKLFNKVIRGLNRAESDKFRTSILNATYDAEIFSKSGLYLGKRDITIVNKDRLKTFTERLVSGLFFHIFNQRIPNHFRVTIALEGNEGLDSLARNISVNNIQEIGGGIFRFAWAEAPDSPLSSIWFMQFYDLVPFGAIIRDPNRPIGNSDKG